MKTFSGLDWEIGADGITFRKGRAVVFTLPVDVGTKVIKAFEDAHAVMLEYNTPDGYDPDWNGEDEDKPLFVIDYNGKLLMDGDHVGWVKKALPGAEHRKLCDFLGCDMQITDDFQR